MGMSDKKINEVLDRYEAKVKEAIEMIVPPTCDQSQKDYDRFDHLGGMVKKVRKFLEEGRREKAFRWLGFMQGAFWILGCYSIEEMANHNRPTKADLKEANPDHQFNTHPGMGEILCELCKEYNEAPAAT